MKKKLSKIISEEIENLAKQGNYEPFENPNVTASRQYRNNATPKEFFNDVVDSNESEERISEEYLHGIVENIVKKILKKKFKKY